MTPAKALEVGNGVNKFPHVHRAQVADSANPLEDGTNSSSSITTRSTQMAKKKETQVPEASTTELVRDESGYGSLPAFKEFHVPAEGFAPGAVVNGNEIQMVKLIDDFDAEDAAAAYVGDGTVSGWTPAKPDGDGWYLAIIADHEEGAFAVWARPGVHGVLTGKDYAQEFLLGSLIKAATKHLKTLSKPFIDMKEGEQRRVLSAVHEDCREAVRDAIDIIASNGRLTFTAAVDQVVFKDGVKCVLTLAKSSEAHSLADAEGSYVTIVIEERSKLLQEGDALAVAKDQKPLFDESNGSATTGAESELEAA